MREKPLLFDYQSTTPCDKDVYEAMQPYWKDFWGNPSSRHSVQSTYASAAIKSAREELAKCLRANVDRIIFTSGATESNNLALIGHARAKESLTGKRGHLITLNTEHSSVLEPIRQLRREGFKVTEITPNSDGIIDLKLLENTFQADTFLVSIMIANNEIGVIQPVYDIAKLCNKYSIKFHSDASQALGNIPIDTKEIDMISFSSHKIYGPKGIGGLLLKKGVSIQPLCWGGNQELGLRPGTIPVPLAIGLSKAVSISYINMNQNIQRLTKLRNKLLFGLQNNIDNLLINGSLESRLPNNLNFTITNVNGNLLHSKLRPFIECSNGSSCSNGKPSHVLLSLGRNTRESESSLRLSLGRYSSERDVELAIDIISRVVSSLKN